MRLTAPTMRLSAPSFFSSLELAERLCSVEPPLMRALRAETESLLPEGAHMLSGTQQGRLLHMLARLGRASRVLEVGSFTGYATMWLAAGLEPGGKLVACERDERCADVARRHLAAAGLSGRVELRMGDAMDTLRQLPPDEPPFDLIFLDADKKRYTDYFELLVGGGKLSPNGLVLSDNVLWKWQVLERTEVGDAELALLSGRQKRALKLRDAMHDFNVHLGKQEHMHQFVLPLRDGLSFSQLQLESLACFDDASAVEAPERSGGEEMASTGVLIDATNLKLTSPPEGSVSPPTGSVRGEFSGVSGVSGSGIASGKELEAFLEQRLPNYLELVASGEPPLLQALRMETEASHRGEAHLLCGTQQGRLLHMLARLGRASRVLEVGSFTGYATMWLAAALEPGGKLVACEPDERCADVARRHLAAAGLSGRVEMRTGAAINVARALSADAHPFELIVWNDHALDPPLELEQMLAPHGLLISTRLLSLQELSSCAVLPLPCGRGGTLALYGRTESDLFEDVSHASSSD